MNKEIITFGDNEIEKCKFHHRKNLILLEYVDIDSILTSSLFFSGEKNYKYFIGYEDDDYDIKQFHMMLLQTSTYVKGLDDEIKWMNFFIKDDNLLKKCNDV